MPDIQGDTGSAFTSEEQQQFDSMRDDAAIAPAEPAEPPAEPAQAEPAAPETTADSQPAQKPQMVPHAALHEERERHKETKRQLEETAKRWEDRFNQIVQRIGQPQPAAQQPQQQQPSSDIVIPPVDQDPLGHVLAQIGKIGATVETLQKSGQQQQQITSQQEAVRATAQRAALLENEFSARTPDYVAAANHLKAARDSELQAMGFSDSVQRSQILANEAMDVARRSMGEGKNPAEVIYALAKLRGFSTPAPAPAAAPEPTPAAAQADAAQKLNQIKGGQTQSRSLSNARGGATSPFTAERILEMSDAEFAKNLENADFLAQFGG